jgi:PAS domain S-box-containing protein
MDSDLTNASAGDRLLLLWSRQAEDHAILLLDPKGVIIGWRGAAERMLGYSPAEAMGAHVSLIFTPQDQESGYPKFELTGAAEDRYSEDSRWHVRTDGARIWVSGTVAPIRGDGGAILGFIKILRDATDQRTQLERFESRVTELGDARDQTHTFLRTLGHEIRNPLAVLNNVHLTLSRIPGDDRLKKLTHHLQDQVTVLRRLADDLMDVSRLELGKVELDLREQDLGELLRSCATGVHHELAVKKLSLQVIVPDAPLLVRIDAARIQQVVANLLNNAIKYNKEGGSVWMKASQEGNEIVCRVQDTGIGIFPPMLPKIFELFSQAPEAKEQREGGIGVGLALVRQVVELHGGTVQARSSGLGKGAEFLFRLPAVVASSGPVEPSPHL